MAGAAYETEDGGLMFHPCAHDCPGIVIGQRSSTGVSVLHFTPTEMLEIGQALVDLAREALG